MVPARCWQEAWTAYTDMRRVKRPMTKLAVTQHMNKLAKVCHEEQIRALNESAAKRYSDVYPKESEGQTREEWG